MGLVVSGAALGGIISGVKSFYKEVEHLNYIITIVEVIVVSYLLIISFCLEETKGRALPDCEEDMPGLLGIRDMCKLGGEEGAPLLQGNGHKQARGSREKSTSETSEEITEGG